MKWGEMSYNQPSPTMAERLRFEANVEQSVFIYDFGRDEDCEEFKKPRMAMEEFKCTNMG